MPLPPRPLLLWSCAAFVLALLASAHADDPVPAPPGPVPAEPALPDAAAPDVAKPPPAGRTYVNLVQLELALGALEAKAQEVGVACVRTEYGESSSGSTLAALWIGDCVARPVVLVHGGLGANDAAGTVAVLDLAWRLLSPEGAEALARVGYLLLPAPNPDALDAFLGGRPRAGGGSADRDLDGARGEDGPDDLDGDGVVRQMRRSTPQGTWASAAEVGREGTPERDARLLLERGLDATRQSSYELFAEGSDEDGDGRVNEDPPGLDLTRGLAGVWDHQGPWGGDGAFAGEAPEARALMELSFGLPNLLAWYGFRSEGPFLLRASEHGALADKDGALYDRVGAALEQRTRVPVRRASERAGGRNPGSDLDWASVHLGALAFALPIWRIERQAAHKAERAAPDELDWLLWSDGRPAGSGFRAWTPYAHPTLGALEIGGWARFTRYEPPVDRLHDAVRSVSGAPLAQAAFVPALALDVRVDDRGQGLFELRLKVRNTGTLPTETPLAVSRQRAQPVLVRLALEPGVERVAGPGTFDAGVLESGHASGEARWLLRRDPPRVNRVPSPLLGTLRAAHRLCPVVTAEVSAP